MHIKLLLLLLTFFAITPNLGFFTIPAFLIITFIFLILLVLLFYQKADKLLDAKIDKNTLVIILFALLFYSGIYYGGLYQERTSILIGQIIFFLLIIYSFFNYFIFKKADKKSFLWIIIATYIFLSVWTIIGSPAPKVDSFFVLKEAPLKFINGENPYSSTFTKVYADKLDYFGYMPFSFIYTLPFVLFFSDPRYGIIFANLISVFILYKFLRKRGSKQIVTLFILTFLFLPRSFFMLEHIYLDSVIFSFFLLYIYFHFKQNNKTSFFILSLFFSFKQNILLLLPILLNKKLFFKSFSLVNIIFFFLPFLFPLYFLFLNKKAFLDDIIFLFNPNTTPAPVSLSLSLSTLIRIFYSNSNLLYFSIIGMVFSLIIYFFLLRENYSFIFKIAIILFVFNFFTYLSFFNHYYIVALFLILDVAFSYFDVNLDGKRIAS